MTRPGRICEPADRGKALLDLRCQRFASYPGQRAVADVESEFLSLLSDEVKDRQHGLALRSTKATTALLQEDRR